MRLPGTRRDLLPLLLSLAVPGPGDAQVRGEVLRLIAPLAHDRFGLYLLALLRRAAEEANPGLRFQAVAAARMTQRRVELEVASPTGSLDLMWGMSSSQRQRELRRVNVRLDQGLLGWRVLVVRADDLARWPADLDVAVVQRRRAGQGLHWPDVAILRDNGYLVQTAADMPTLYEMLQRRHIDYFPRSAMEVTDELANLAPRGVTIVPDLALRYDAGNYVFLGAHREPAAAALESALQLLAARGELKRRFEAAFEPQLRELHLERRRLIELRNTLD
ncbi:MAG: hypothetical protein EKK53_20325 [Burkholderiales bacterium]|nr:MAG: hypothetical protein EKK53_20325 [Burkholderiales bacterium]